MARGNDNDHTKCPQCGHSFRLSEANKPMIAVAPVAPKPPIRDRSTDLARVRELVKAAFPACRVTTNDDHNAGTPYIVTVQFQNSRSRAVRADHVKMDPEIFAKRAIESLKAWRSKVISGNSAAA